MAFDDPDEELDFGEQDVYGYHPPRLTEARLKQSLLNSPHEYKKMYESKFDSSTKASQIVK